MTDPGVIREAPALAAVLPAAAADASDAPGPAELQDRCRGALLGLAAGNLLGLPAEGMWYFDIPRHYPDGLNKIDWRESARPLDDDLAQAVELGEALADGGDYLDGFARRLVAWAEENGRGMGLLTGAVIVEMQFGAAPLPEPAQAVYRRNPIAPNGGVMRCAPVALARRRRPEALIADSAATCAVTHYAPACQWSCVIVNAVIARLLEAPPPGPAKPGLSESALAEIVAAARQDGAPDLAAMLEADATPADVLRSLAAGRPVTHGANWLRQEARHTGHTLLALQCGLWAAVTPLPLEEALVGVVNAGGDADTNGAVAGAVLGARYGASAIPQRWLDCIPQRRRIEALADALLSLSGVKPPQIAASDDC